MTIDRVAIDYKACTADKDCGKCYQYENADFGDDERVEWCHQYDIETRRGMRCALFGTGKPKEKQGETNEPSLF